MPFPAPVVSLPSVADALDGLKSQSPQLILLEAGSGDRLLTACRELRQVVAAPDIPLIALITQINERESVLAAGPMATSFCPCCPAS